jgi:flagellar biogenesis protein FliO
MSALKKGTDSRKLISSAVALGMVLLVAWAMVLSQSEQAASGTDLYDQARIDSLRVTLGRDLPSAPAENPSRVDTGKLWLVFILMAGALGGVWWFFGRKKVPSTVLKDPLPVIFEQDLGNGQRVMAVEAGAEIWVLGVTPQNITLLDRQERENATWITEKAAPVTPMPTFAALLKQFSGGKPQ